MTAERAAMALERVPTDVARLDEVLGGGLLESTSTIISGSTGAGKTPLALGFAVDSARRGRPALYVSFEEGGRQIERNAESFGWDLCGLTRRGLLDIYDVSPSDHRPAAHCRGPAAEPARPDGCHQARGGDDDGARAGGGALVRRHSDLGVYDGAAWGNS